MQPTQLLMIEYGSLSNASLRTIDAENLKEIVLIVVQVLVCLKWRMVVIDTQQSESGGG